MYRARKELSSKKASADVYGLKKDKCYGRALIS